MPNPCRRRSALRKPSVIKRRCREASQPRWRFHSRRLNWTEEEYPVRADNWGSSVRFFDCLQKALESEWLFEVGSATRLDCVAARSLAVRARHKDDGKRMTHLP